MPTWMTTLWNDATLVPLFQNRPLSAITIPGTHDSGCYVDHVLNMFSRTQTQTIGQQLTGGIRYFDLRPKRTQNGQIWAWHGPYLGGRIDGQGGIIDQIAAFMAGVTALGERDLVILNISHFSGFDNAAHQALITEINNRLGPYLVPHTQWGANAIDLFQAPLVALLTDPANAVVGPRVAILYDGALDQGIDVFIPNVFAGVVPAPGAAANQLPPGFFVLSPKYVAAANPIYLFDWYSNATDLDAMRTDQLDKLRNRTDYRYDNLPNGDARWPGGDANWPTDNLATGVGSTLHLLSWTLTPQWRVVGDHDPVTVAANETNPALLDLFNNPARGWNGPNYRPTIDLRFNILYVDNYASWMRNLVGTPWGTLAMPVAIAARLNVGALTW